MRNIVMAISYDGTGFCGFQIQPKGRTVQHELEQAIGLLTGERAAVHGSGRTDAGVHAFRQVLHVHTESLIPIERWAIAMNTRLPEDIVVHEVWEAPLSFHSRRAAKRKTYRYTIHNSKFPDVFNRNYSYHYYQPLHVEAMREGLSYLLGEHDFTSFTNIRSTKASHVRTILEAQIVQEGPKIHTYITGNGFLYNMVRIIMGTLIRVGEGKIPPEKMKAILAACDRSKAGPTAMAHGLALWDVAYGPRAFEVAKNEG